MDDHEALVHSLGEHCVTYIGKADLRQLTVTLDFVNRVAHVEICLEDDSWPARERAIDKMIEVRQMFLDEVSIDYAFSSAGSCIGVDQSQVEYSFA